MTFFYLFHSKHSCGLRQLLHSLMSPCLSPLQTLKPAFVFFKHNQHASVSGLLTLLNRTFVLRMLFQNKQSSVLHLLHRPYSLIPLSYIIFLHIYSFFCFLLQCKPQDQTILFTAKSQNLKPCTYTITITNKYQVNE